MDDETYPPRRATKGAIFGYTGPDGEQRELVADAKGIVTPETAQDVEILDGFDLPIARVADVPRETSKPADTGAED